MPSYLVTGASRGLGYGFVKVLAADPANTVIAVSRDEAATQEKLAKDGITSAHVFQADIIDRDALKTVAAKVQDSVGAIDYLICNACYKTMDTQARNLGEYEDDPEYLDAELEKSFKVNVIGLINTVNTFMPLVKRSTAKSVIALTSANGNREFVNEIGLGGAIPYAVTKAGVDLLVAKYNVAYKDAGVLVMGICAGAVDTTDGAKLSLNEEDIKKLQARSVKLREYAPGFAGPASLEDGTKQLLKVIHSSSLEKGNGGTCVSYFGDTKRWLK